MSACSSHASPAIFCAPVRQAPVIFTLNGGPNVYNGNPFQTALSQQCGSLSDQGIGGGLKIGRGQIVVLKINQQQRRFHEKA